MRWGTAVPLPQVLFRDEGESSFTARDQNLRTARAASFGTPSNSFLISVTRSVILVSYDQYFLVYQMENGFSVSSMPNGVQAENVAGNVRKALHMHPFITGAVTMFSAYGDFNAFSRRLREGCQRTGVKLVDVPNGRKFATDKAILVDMFLFALDNRPPASILLISGDADFSPALYVLGQRGYTVVVVVPAIYDVQSELSSAGRFLWDWPTVARGDGFIPPSVVPCRHEPSEYHISCQIADRNNGHIEEMLVRKETSRSKYSIPAEMGPVLPPEYAHN
ncbi:hypothetical protein Taro_042437 [Colocasia esculenta]|uniref:NYN domain-containing protein n=1 Tax=Colocasia esculenta TaxID=4460 RepID=A0A843WGV3_COLES|nr:hypothetical protein [Colocasia esculenta]